MSDLELWAFESHTISKPSMLIVVKPRAPVMGAFVFLFGELLHHQRLHYVQPHSERSDFERSDFRQQG